MVRVLLALAVICTVPGNAAGENSYALDPAGDIILGTVSLGVFGASLLVPENNGLQQQYEEINRIDRCFISSFKPVLSKAGTLSACAGLVLPAVSTAGYWDDFQGLAVLAVMYSEAFILTAGIKDLLKKRIVRWRPYTYSSTWSGPGESDNEYEDSFPSGHTAYAFMGASFAAAAAVHRFQNRTWRIAVPAAGYTLAAATGIFRIAGGEHFLSDVLAGAAIGSLCGWLVPYLHQTVDTVSISPAISGAYGISVRIQL